MKKLIILSIATIVFNLSVNAMNLPEENSNLITSGAHTPLTRAVRSKGPARRNPSRAAVNPMMDTHLNANQPLVPQVLNDGQMQTPISIPTQPAPQNPISNSFITNLKNTAANNKKTLLALALLAITSGVGYKLYGTNKKNSVTENK